MNRRLNPARPYHKYWVCSCEEINSEEVNICAGCGQSLIAWARSMLIPVCTPQADPHELLIAIVAAVRIEGSQKKAAAKFGISPQYLNDILKGNREIPDKVARHFGVRRVIRYEKLPEANP